MTPPSTEIELLETVVSLLTVIAIVSSMGLGVYLVRFLILAKNQRKIWGAVLSAFLLQGRADAQTIVHQGAIYGSTATINIPSDGSCNPGDVAIVFCGQNSNSNTPTIPANFQSNFQWYGSPNNYGMCIAWRELQAGDIGSNLGTFTNVFRSRLCVVSGIDADNMTVGKTDAAYHTWTDLPDLHYIDHTDALLFRAFTGSDGDGIEISSNGWTQLMGTNQMTVQTVVATASPQTDNVQFREYFGHASCMQLVCPVTSTYTGPGGGGGGDDPLNPPYTNPTQPQLGDDGSGCVVAVYRWEAHPLPFLPVPWQFTAGTVVAQHPSLSLLGPPTNPPTDPMTQEMEDWLNNNGYDGSNLPGWYVYDVVYASEVGNSDQAECELCGVGCDNCEPWGDFDGDGIPNSDEIDMDDNGINDFAQSPPPCGSPLSPCVAAGDADGDGIRNDQESDADGDGVPNESDCSPYGNSCGGCTVGGCLPTDGYDGDGIANQDETDPDVDNDGIPNEDDATPYGTGPGCESGECGNAGDADFDGIRNDKDPDGDQDGDGIADELDQTPQGDNCDATDFCLTEPLPLPEVIDGECMQRKRDSQGDLIEPPEYEPYQMPEEYEECDFDNDGCINRDDPAPCDPEIDCDDCVFDLQEFIDDLSEKLEEKFDFDLAALVTQFENEQAGQVFAFSVDLGPVIGSLNFQLIPDPSSVYRPYFDLVHTFVKALIVLAVAWSLLQRVMHDLRQV